ncbi:MAG: SAM-dependent methyltransferase, partial [Xanthobacteraceae bacterium]
MTAWDALAARRTAIPVFAPGHVWLAGAGPGDPGLLTLDALAGLAQADVVVHDALVDQRVLALAGPQARLEFAGKRGGKPSPLQADISERLVALARARHRVLRL